MAKVMAKRRQTSVKGLEKLVEVKESLPKTKTPDDYRSLDELLDELLGEGVNLGWAEVTPAISKVFLKFNAPNNRYGPNTQTEGRRENGHVTSLRHKMKFGNWNDSNAATIQVSCDGWMFDGYHRMAALSGLAKDRPDMAIKFLVARNIDPSAMKVTDKGLNRTLTQTLRIEGLDVSDLEKSLISTMLWNIGDCKKSEYLTEEQKIALYRKYRKAIKFAATLYNGKYSIKLAAVRGAIARAYASLDAEHDIEVQEDLARFIQVLDTCKSTSDREKVIINLHCVARDAQGRKGSGSRAAKEVLNAKTINALRWFLKGDSKDRSSLMTARKQYFPLPEDDMPTALIGVNADMEGKK